VPPPRLTWVKTLLGGGLAFASELGGRPDPALIVDVTTLFDNTARVRFPNGIRTRVLAL